MSQKAFKKDLVDNCGKYESIFNTAVLGITILDAKGILLEANPTFLTHLGLRNGKNFNKHYSEFFNPQAADELKRMLEMINSGHHHLLKVLVTHKTDQGYHKLIEVSISQISSSFNKSFRYKLITEDISNKQDMHAALLQSEKLALTGRLAASLAHEINNPLQTSLGCLGLVEEMLEEDSKLKIYIDLAIKELQRSARIVKKLRDLNLKGDLSDFSSVNLQKIIDDTLLLIKNKIDDRDIITIINCDGPAPIVRVSEDQIHQVFLNIIMNAIDAMPNGGRLILGITKTTSPNGTKIIFKDTGVGIKKDQIINLFDPFYTTRENGLGLGLYICKEIIQYHKGSLEVNSEMGKGTKISIWLPDYGLDEELIL